MSRRDNLLRAVRFESPDYIPMRFDIHPVCWISYPPDALHEMMTAHPFLFPHASAFVPPSAPLLHPWERAGGPWTDAWGCVWQTQTDGVPGQVVKHPLEKWDAMENFEPPDPEADSGMGPIHWGRIAEEMANAGTDRPARASLPEGHTFQRLVRLRGYDNLLADVEEKSHDLLKLLRTIQEFNLALVRRFLDFGAEWLDFRDDLGLASGPALSPGTFRQVFRPVFERLVAPAREKGCVVEIASGGEIRTLAKDILAIGPQVIGLQDLVNGIEWIRQNLTGRVCVDLEIDREQITPFAAPRRIDTLIHEEVESLSRREGGLSMTYTLRPGVPLQNVKAIMDAMERYSLHSY